MARGRMISCAIATDEDFNNMSVDAQFLFMRAVPHLDRDGLVSGTLNSLWAKIAPLLPQYISRMGGIVNEWVEHDFVVRYRDGKREVLFFKGFCKNQANMRYDREAESIFSPPPGYKRTERGLQIDDKSAGGNGAGGSDSNATKSNAGVTPEQCRSNAGVTPDEEKLREDNLREGNTTTTPLPPTQTANSGGGGGGDAHPVVISSEPNSPKTEAPVSAQVATLPVEPVTANAAPPVATPPPVVEEIHNLLTENGFIERNSDGSVPPLIEEKITGWVRDFSSVAIQQAVVVSIGAKKRSLNYVEGVLKGNGRKGYETSNQNNGRTFGAIPAINAFAGNGANYATNQPGGERDYLYNPLTPEEKEQRRAARRAENDRIRAEMAAEAAAVKLH